MILMIQINPLKVENVLHIPPSDIFLRILLLTLRICYYN
jgi:hypothetical protein